MQAHVAHSNLVVKKAKYEIKKKITEGGKTDSKNIFEFSKLL